MGGALLIAPAQASFPGQNGKIAFERGRDVWTMNPDGSGATALTTGGGTLDPAWAPGAQPVALRRVPGYPAGIAFGGPGCSAASASAFVRWIVPSAWCGGA